MPPAPDIEQRQYYRLRYPMTERPTFLYAEKAYAVVDISARGLLYIIPNGPLPELHTPITGILRFRRGAQCKIEGIVIRVHNDQVALYLPDHEIPFAILINEQRYLHMRYPMWS